MCSTRLVGDQEWTDAERVEGSPLSSWFLEEMEIQPHNRGGKIHYNHGNLARVVLMCDNAVDLTRDAISDLALVRSQCIRVRSRNQ